MTLPVSDPAFWRERIVNAPRDAMHHAVFVCPLDRWRRIEAKHREILARHIQTYDYVLDAGCGWGRLLDIMPGWWAGTGAYLGVDCSPDFIALANERHPSHAFRVGDLRAIDNRLDTSDPSTPTIKFDWAVLISVRPMIRRNLGDAEWGKMEAELRRVAKRLLFLEYDETDEGSIE